MTRYTVAIYILLTLVFCVLQDVRNCLRSAGLLCASNGMNKTGSVGIT